MAISHIFLSDGSISISLPTGPVTIGPNSLNYRPIRKALLSDGDAETIVALLSETATNGIYYAIELNGSLYIRFIDPIDYSICHFPPSNDSTVPNNISKAKPSGAYTSKEALLADFPEYLI
jgi:hypothetical protein